MELRLTQLWKVATFYRECSVGRHFKIEWPSRSPDLTPCDFFFWRFLRDRIYRVELGPVNDCNDLSNRILKEFDWIRENAMEDVRAAVNSFYDRLDLCVQLDGSQLGLAHR